MYKILSYRHKQRQNKAQKRPRRFRNSFFASVSERTTTTTSQVTDVRNKISCQSTFYLLDFSLSIRLLFLVASKSAGISVYHNHDSFVCTGPFFGSTFTILTTFQIGVLARTTFALIRLLFALCMIFARTNLGYE